MLYGKKIVALCITKINEDSSRKFITALNNALPRDCRLMVFATCSQLFWDTAIEAGESAIFDLMDLDAIDIVVIHVEKVQSKQVVEDILSRAAAHGKPVITIDREFDNSIGAVYDYEAGFKSVVEHVVDVHGASRLHMIAGVKDNDFSEKRIEVFAEVLRSRGLGFDKETMVSYGDFWGDPAAAAVRRLIKEDRLPEAIVCANDTMAIAVVNTLSEHGIRIPQDVIVTGFDGIDDIKLCTPKITSCMCSYGGIAERIGGIIDVCLKGEPTEKLYRIPAEIVLSESCGCRAEEVRDAQRELFDLGVRFFRYQEEEYSMYGLVARAISCETVEELSAIIRNSGFYDVDCALNPECLDETANPLCKAERADAYGEEMIDFFSSDEVLYDSYKLFPRKELFPRMKKLLEYDDPLLLFGLNFRNVPLGYVCFHFHSDDAGNFYKVPQVIRALNNAIGGYRNMRHQHYLRNRVEEVYKVDNLTGLYNRNGFNKEFRRIVEQAVKSGGVVSAALVDLDGLKLINDTYGHEEGDNAIKTAAAAFRACCPKGSICVRFGGDEMMAVYNGTIDEAKLRGGINTVLNSYNSTSDKPYRVSVSVGVYICGDTNGMDFDELVKESDKLMYMEKRTKKTSRRRVEV